ncbi:MAG: hypothetical protein V1692_01240 [bacterium]
MEDRAMHDFANAIKVRIDSVLGKNTTLNLRLDSDRNQLRDAIMNSIKKTLLEINKNLNTQINALAKKTIDDLFPNTSPENNTSLNDNI